MFKSGFVTIVGRPNVGKSTLLNEIMGEKLSIVSNKPQTTRNNIQTILTGEDYQLVFVDTPGCCCTAKLFRHLSCCCTKFFGHVF